LNQSECGALNRTDHGLLLTLSQTILILVVGRYSQQLALFTIIPAQQNLGAKSNELHQQHQAVHAANFNF